MRPNTLTLNGQDDTIHVSLWKQLVSWGCTHAAVGLLCDVFDELEWADEVAEKLAAVGKELPPLPLALSKDRLSPSALVRSDLMTMLGDNDGDKLSAWRNCYIRDRDAFVGFAACWVEQACGK
jgi:hypothetical protein